MGQEHPRWKKQQVQRHQGERVLLSGNDQEASVVGARTQEEGRDFAEEQSHRAFPHGEDRGLWRTRGEMGSHEGLLLGKQHN